MIIENIKICCNVTSQAAVSSNLVQVVQQFLGISHTSTRNCTKWIVVLNTPLDHNVYGSHPAHTSHTLIPYCVQHNTITPGSSRQYLHYKSCLHVNLINCPCGSSKNALKIFLGNVCKLKSLFPKIFHCKASNLNHGSALIVLESTLHQETCKSI